MEYFSGLPLLGTLGDLWRNEWWIARGGGKWYAACGWSTCTNISAQKWPTTRSICTIWASRYLTFQLN